MTALFINIRWLDIVDIFLVGLLIFQLYQLVRGTVAIKIFIGILSIYILWKLVEFLQMDMLGEILGQFIGVGVIALLIVFQQELRRFLLVIGNTRLFNGKNNALGRFFGRTEDVNTETRQLINACTRMARDRTGALIVVSGTSDPSIYTISGIEVDAKLTDRLLESIFFKDSPLHDGATIIRDNRITHARCVLPVTENPKFPGSLGMRHRAAVGISENCDALTIVVSEQTGTIALAKQGTLKTDIDADDLEKWLVRMLK